MRGQIPSDPNFISLINVETMIPTTHPIRAIKRLCDEVLATMSQAFDKIYSAAGAPSIPPETLLKGKVLQALYTVRSDRQLCARLQTDLMFRWFLDLPLDEAVFDASTYSKNQSRLLQHESRTCSSPPWLSWPGITIGSPTNTSAWTGRSLRRGRR